MAKTMRAVVLTEPGPIENLVISELPVPEPPPGWVRIAVRPTAYGPLTIGLDLQRGQSLLIRGGTASVGLAAAAVTKDLGATMLSTTRQRDRADTPEGA